MYSGKKDALNPQEVQSIIGLDTSKEPFHRTIVARGRDEIEAVLENLRDSRIRPQGTYESNTGIPDESFVTFMSPPEELHPSTWQELGRDAPRTPPAGRFEQQTLPEKNPAVAFSRFANELHCASCGKLNVAPKWPARGDAVPFYFQTAERTREEAGAYRLKVHCPHCKQDWFVVWDDTPA
jgi:ribosomal protein S27E